MIPIIEALSFNSLFGLLASIISRIIIYKTLNKYHYLINVAIYMLSRTLFGFIISKIIIAITKSQRSVKLTVVEFILNLIIGTILVAAMKKLYSKGYKKFGFLLVLCVVIEAIINLGLSLIFSVFV